MRTPGSSTQTSITVERENPSGGTHEYKRNAARTFSKLGLAEEDLLATVNKETLTNPRKDRRKTKKTDLKASRHIQEKQSKKGKELL